MKKNRANMIYTIFVFTILAAFDNLIIGLFPPLFQSISHDLHIKLADMGIISAVNILVTAVSSIFWGYLSGRFKRKRLIMAGTLIWALSVFLTAICTSFFQLLLFQILTGIGLGCIASIGFSVLTDSIPYRMRGLVLSLWGMAQGLGGIGGSIMASLIATASSWRTPFEIVGFIGLILIVLYFFVQEPSRGGADPELQELIKSGKSYKHMIQAKQILTIAFKGSNKYLFLQAFFMNVATGSLIWLPTLYIFKIQFEGYRMSTAMIASGYLYAIFQLGGMSSALFGHIGDRLQRKSYKGRAYFTALFVFLTLPFYVFMFLLPMNHLSLPENGNPPLILIALIKQIFLNPWIALLFLLSVFASASQSANTPNWLALISDVNLPEHRGAAFSLANLSNSLGRTLGNVGVGVLLNVVSSWSHEPYSYTITLSLLQAFLIPAGLCYILMAKHNVLDIRNVKATLRARSKG